MEEIINEFQEFCGNLAISGDSPSAETIKQYFDRYAKALQLQQTGVSGRSEQLPNTCECDNVETYNGWGNESCVRCIDCGRVW